MSNTSNTGTKLIDGNAFTPESLRFESEPWIRFYMAGEVIRESRKASGKQSHYACEAQFRGASDRGNMSDQDIRLRNVGNRSALRLTRMVASKVSDAEGNIGHQEHEYRPRIQPSPITIPPDGPRPPGLDETIDRFRHEEIRNGRETINSGEPSFSRMGHSCRTRCNSIASPVPLVGD